MSEHINRLFKDVRNARLSENEKAVMRNELEFFIAENPPHAPLLVRAADYFGSFFEGGTVRGVRMHPFATAFAFVFVVVGGTSYAAEGALPGDTLYGVKVGVNESLEGSLAITHTAKADWQAEVMTRRLIEAETLASEGRLTPLARAELEEQINKTANEFDATIATLAKSDAGVTKVAEAQSNLEASLVGHADVLAALSTELPESRPTLTKILAVVRARASLSQDARASAEIAISQSAEDGVRVAALQKKEVASGALSNARQSKKSKVANEPVAPQTLSMRASASTSADAGTTTLSAEQALSVGEQKLEAGEYGEAFSTFQAVIRAVTTARVHSEAEARLNTTIDPTEAAGSATTSATSTATTSIQTQ